MPIIYSPVAWRNRVVVQRAERRELVRTEMHCCMVASLHNIYIIAVISKVTLVVSIEDWRHIRDKEYVWFANGVPF